MNLMLKHLQVVVQYRSLNVRAVLFFLPTVVEPLGSLLLEKEFSSLVLLFLFSDSILHCLNRKLHFSSFNCHRLLIVRVGLDAFEPLLLLDVFLPDHRLLSPCCARVSDDLRLVVEESRIVALLVLALLFFHLLSESIGHQVVHLARFHVEEVLLRFHGCAWKVLTKHHLICSCTSISMNLWKKLTLILDCQKLGWRQLGCRDSVRSRLDFLLNFLDS